MFKIGPSPRQIKQSEESSHSTGEEEEAYLYFMADTNLNYFLTTQKKR